MHQLVHCIMKVFYITTCGDCVTFYCITWPSSFRLTPRKSCRFYYYYYYYQPGLYRRTLSPTPMACLEVGIVASLALSIHYFIEWTEWTLSMASPWWQHFVLL